MIEQPFSFELDGYHFSGKIDRVDKLNGNGEIEIIDYKTGREPSKEDRESQLLLYKLAFEHDPTLKAMGLKPIEPHAGTFRGREAEDIPDRR